MKHKQEAPQCATSNRTIANDQRGLTTVEYVIVLVLIAVVGIGVWRTFGQNVQAQVTSAAASVQAL